MPKYRSATTTHGRNMAGARALWRATGMTDADSETDQHLSGRPEKGIIQ